MRVYIGQAVDALAAIERLNAFKRHTGRKNLCVATSPRCSIRHRLRLHSTQFPLVASGEAGGRLKSIETFFGGALDADATPILIASRN